MNKEEFDKKYGNCLDKAFVLFREGRLRELELENLLDLMRDEFKRIAALPEATSEVVGLCERAQTEIEQRVPLIAQRDKALANLQEANRRLKCVSDLLICTVKEGSIHVPGTDDPRYGARVKELLRVLKTLEVKNE